MRNNHCILLIDDDPSINRLLAARLEAQGYQMEIAADGHSGIRKAGYVHPDLIILDYRMEGMDGLQVMAALAHGPQTRDIPILVLSANINSSQRDRALELGASYILQKPYEPKTVIDTAAAAIRSGRPRQATGRKCAELSPRSPTREASFAPPSRQRRTVRAKREYCGG